MESLINGTKEWLAHPFKEDGSALDWFLFLGLVAAITWMWSRVIVRITG